MAKVVLVVSLLLGSTTAIKLKKDSPDDIIQEPVIHKDIDDSGSKMREMWLGQNTAAAAATARVLSGERAPAAERNLKRKGNDAVDNIVKKHDKVLIEKLKEVGKISEGFPDLTFVHIPKTGGDAIALSSAPIFPYGFGLRNNLALNLMIERSKQGPNHCYFEQLPPKEIASMYSKQVSMEAYEKRTVMCSVRNPYDRVVSEYNNCVEFGQPGKCSKKCDVQDLNNWVQTELLAFQKGDYLRNQCFHIPQTEYLEGAGGCTKVLDFANLERDFNNVMQETGYNLTLPKQQALKSKCSGKISAANLTKQSQKLIEVVYAKDFKELGPKYGWSQQSIGETVKAFLMAPINALTTVYLETEDSLVLQQ